MKLRSHCKISVLYISQQQREHGAHRYLSENILYSLRQFLSDNPGVQSFIDQQVQFSPEGEAGRGALTDELFKNLLTSTQEELQNVNDVKDIADKTNVSVDSNKVAPPNILAGFPTFTDPTSGRAQDTPQSENVGGGQINQPVIIQLQIDGRTIAEEVTNIEIDNNNRD